MYTGEYENGGVKKENGAVGGSEGSSEGTVSPGMHA